MDSCRLIIINQDVQVGSERLSKVWDSIVLYTFEYTSTSRWVRESLTCLAHVQHCQLVGARMDKTQEQLQKAKYGGLVPKKKLLPKVQFAC